MFARQLGEQHHHRRVGAFRERGPLRRDALHEPGRIPVGQRPHRDRLLSGQLGGNVPQRRAEQMVREQQGRHRTGNLDRVHRLDQTPPSTLPPKARLLSEAACHGLPVPAGVVHPMQWSEALEAAAAALLSDGPLIVRAALEGEDGPERAAAGLGLSIPNLSDLAAARGAIEQADDARRDPWLTAYRGTERSPHDCVIVQRQVEREVLVVAAALPGGMNFVEVHGTTFEALAHGDTPDFSGLLERWADARAARVASVITRVREALEMPEHGFDLELVVDPRGETHLVQVRPLTRDLVAEGRTFLDAVDAAGHGDRLGGVQVLDAEHNPAPLSPAHASLIAWLATQRPASGGLTTLAGWLYARTRVRDLSGTPTRPVLSPRDALQRLRDVELPAARERLARVRDAEGPAMLDAALDAFVAMIDVYLGVLLPVRAAAGKVFAAAPDAPISLRDRATHADVLPSAWDVAAPTLGELGTFDAAEDTAALPTDPVAAAMLLTEWDDHLFALGLAPVRAAYRAAARRSNMAEEIFGLELDDLRRTWSDPKFEPGPIARANLERTADWARLRPPLMIDEGRPVPLLPHRLLHGVAVGQPFEGPIAQREGLEALLRDPPSPDCIVVLPALTAQAALALESLQLRAVCCEHGGALSHAALMLRELGLSGLIGCSGCTRVPDGVHARIDTAKGRLQIASSVTLGS